MEESPERADTRGVFPEETMATMSAASKLEKLVQDLATAKQRGKDRRAKRQEEMEDLWKHHYEPVVQALAKKGEAFEEEFDQTYQRALTELWEKSNEPLMPKDVFSLQVGLCREIHSHMVQLHQIHLLKKWYRKISKFLEREIEYAKEDSKLVRRELNASIHRLNFQKLRMEKEKEAKLSEQQQEIHKLRKMLGEKLSVKDVDDINELPLNVLKEMKTPKFLRKSAVWIDVNGPELDTTDSNDEDLDNNEYGEVGFDDLKDVSRESKPSRLFDFVGGQACLSASERSVNSGGPTRPNKLKSFSKKILNGTLDYLDNSDSSLEDYLYLPESTTVHVNPNATTTSSKDNPTNSTAPAPSPRQSETPAPTKKAVKGSEDSPSKSTSHSTRNSIESKSTSHSARNSIEYVIDPAWSEDSARLSPTTRKLKMLSAAVFSDSWRPIVEERYNAMADDMAEDVQSFAGDTEDPPTTIPEDTEEPQTTMS